MSNESDSQQESPATESEDVQDVVSEVAVKDPLTEAQEQAAQLKDQLLRTSADFDNFRKRSRREVDDARVAGKESLLKALLPVFDNLERATSHAATATDTKSFASGIEMVIRQFNEALGRSGIDRVESATGLPFDPTLHEAISQVESHEYGAGTVASEVQAGYKAAHRLIRPAMVVVSKGPGPESSESEAEKLAD